MSSGRGSASVLTWREGFFPPRDYVASCWFVVLIAQSHGQAGKGRCEKCFYAASVEMLISSFNFFSQLMGL